MALNSTHLSHFIAQNNIDAAFVYLEVETPTVADAAVAVGVQPKQIIKSVLFLADKKPVLVIANGLTRVDRKQLADYLGVARRRVKIASAAQVLRATGYAAGTVPPFGHREPIPTVVEEGVLAQTVVYGGGGEIDALLKLTTAELQRIVGSDIAPLAET